MWSTKVKRYSPISPSLSSCHHPCPSSPPPTDHLYLQVFKFSSMFSYNLPNIANSYEEADTRQDAIPVGSPAPRRLVKGPEQHPDTSPDR